MASRTLPGLGLKGDWNLGEDGWKDEMDVNLRVLSILVGQQVLEIVAVEPGVPTEGDIVILDETHATRPNEIAAYDEAAWRYIVPIEGMQLHNLDDGRRYTFTGGVWVPPASGSAWKEPVRAASTAAVTLATAFENGDTIDGVVLTTGDRILIKDQAAGAENGIYIVAAAGAPVRASDADTGIELVNATVKVSEGTTQADRQWQCTNNSPIILGTTALTWAEQASSGGTAAERLAGSSTTAGTPASAVETDLHSFTLAAGTLTADNQVLRIRFFGRYTFSTRNRTVRLYVGGVAVVSFSTTSNGVFNWEAQIDVVRKSATTYSWASRARYGSGTADTSDAINVGNAGAATWSGSVVVKVTGQSAAGAVANDITAEGSFIERLL